MLRFKVCVFVWDMSPLPPVDATCGPHQFHCEVSGECINGNLVCNAFNDCADGSDEELSSCSKYISLLYSVMLLYNDTLQVILSNQSYHVILACFNALISVVVLQEINIVIIVVNVLTDPMSITVVSCYYSIVHM